MNIARPCNRWRIGREVITDPEVAKRLRGCGWELEELPEEMDEAYSRPRKRQRGVPRWRIGAYIIEDEHEAQRLRDQDWVVEEVLDDGNDDGDDDTGVDMGGNTADDDDRNGIYVRHGRPRKRRRAGTRLDMVDPLG